MTTMTLIKQTLKKDFNSVYSYQDYLLISDKIANILKDTKIININKILAKYTKFQDDKLIINTKDPSYYSYQDVLNKILLV